MEKLWYTHKYVQEYINQGLAMTDLLNSQLTPKAEEILDALRAANGWISRSALAARLNKSALNKWDLVLLGKLAEAGLVETRQVPHHGPIGYEWQYRSVSNDQR
jgi:hypothetical protein